MAKPLHPAEPADTSHLLNNLDQAIDRARLVRKIIELGDNLRIIEGMPNQSNRIRFLRDEISNLESQLKSLE